MAKTCLRAIRPYHMVKNLLLFIPLLVGHHYFNLDSFKKSLIGFLVFCFLASSAYLINDLVDIEKDKQHSRKQKRPFAAGELPNYIGFILAPCLFIIALVISFYLPLNFLLSAMAYYSLTLFYSFFIKQKKWLDVALLAFLYSLRVFSGMALVENGYSLWLIIFMVFLFFNLALLKRYAELYNVQLENKLSIVGRAYRLSDRAKLVFGGKISACFAILTFVFYIQSNKVVLLYKNPLLLWLICPCLFIWLKRSWYFAQHGKMQDDPVVFTVTDKFSWLVVTMIAVISLFAL